MEFWALTFDFMGKVLIATTALMAHHVIAKEKKIDKLVLKDLKVEFGTGIIGILFLILGYVLHLVILNNR